MALYYKSKLTKVKKCLCCKQEMIDRGETHKYHKDCARFISNIRSKLGGKYRRIILNLKNKINMLENQLEDEHKKTCGDE